MSVQDNTQITKAALEAFEAHDMDRFVSFMSESVGDYVPGRAEPLRGREAVREDNIGFLAMYPDVTYEITQIFGSGDMVCAQGIVKGTNTGPLPGPDGKELPPTNQSFRVPACFVVKIEDGKISEIHEYLDRLEFSTQLGNTG